MASQRYRTFSYAPLDAKFTDTSCTVTDVELPEISRSYIANVYLAQENAPQYFHTTERKEIVDFKVTYIPHDIPAGRELLPFVKQIVEEVLQNKFVPAVATIQLLRNGTVDEEVQINDCVITKGEILIDVQEYIKIKFHLQGLLTKDY